MVIRWIVLVLAILCYVTLFIFFREMANPEKVESGKIPYVVKFAFKDFTAEGDKWFATCKKCNVKLSEKKTVTSGFTK